MINKSPNNQGKNTLDEILKVIENKNNTLEIYGEISRMIKLYHGIDWHNHLKYFEHNCRFNIIYKNDKYQLLLLTFLPRQSCKFTRISQTGNIYKVIYGVLTHREFYREKYFTQQSTVLIKNEGETHHLEQGEHEFINSEKQIPLVILMFTTVF